MRRSDKEIRDPDILARILEKASVGYLALSDGTTPYCIPINFAFSDRSIFLHSATEGKKLEILEKNNRASFQADAFIEPVSGKTPCSFGMKFASVNCSGVARIVSSPEEKRQALEIISRKYTGESGYFFSDEQVAGVACIVISVEEITGKLSGYTLDELSEKLTGPEPV